MNDRRPTCLLAALAAIVFVSGCGRVATSPATTAPPRPAPTSAAAATPTPGGGIPKPIATDPGGVAAVIGEIVIPGGQPLLPAYVPPGMSASVRTYQGQGVVHGDAYNVTYTDDTHTTEITLSVNAGANPPPVTGPNPGSSHITFRGARTQYTVYDTTAPTSQRYLMWPDDKGIATGPPGPDYFLGATGLTEAEFFRVANSLQAV